MLEKPPRSVEKAAHDARIRRLKASLEEARAAREEKAKLAKRAIVRLDDLQRENSRLRERIEEMQRLELPAATKARKVLGLRLEAGYPCPHCGSKIPENEEWCEVAKANIASWRRPRPEPLRG